MKSGASLIALAAVSAMVAGCSGGEDPEPEGPAETPSPTESQEPDQNDLEAEDSSMHGVEMNPEGAELTIDNLPVSSPDGQIDVPDDAFPGQLTALDWGWQEYGLEEGSPCDSGQAVLVRDGTDVEAQQDCTVIDGAWFNLLGGNAIGHEDVEVAPFVPVEHVWQVGAAEWDGYQQSIYANAPDSIVPIDPEMYEERADQGPEDWRPDDESLWCAYSLRWVSVKNNYGMPLASEGERDALEEMVATCGTGESTGAA